jgi:hypothetical protein
MIPANALQVSGNHPHPTSAFERDSLKSGKATKPLTEAKMFYAVQDINQIPKIDDIISLYFLKNSVALSLLYLLDCF